ncbi:MAG TPA: alpha-amylase family glycosyl hydrolase [Solirubrobacteraceae bacterium]|nr:alpha-amylase family glycosyl hydrolase [Solirubrobacteraceae bacterium]
MPTVADPVWWRDAVVYQIYPRSFQDSDGDGEGDLRGIAQRLQHIVALGADAIWLSPVYPSPMADGGYDVADYTDVDARFGTLADLDALIAAAHDAGLRVLMDVVPCHTSIEHPWFREHPERYVWSDRDGPQNNWLAAFGGPAWSPDPHGRGWYLHSFYPEQPDLDWRREDVRAAFAEILRFWIDRGVDGFRLDAIDRLLKDPQLRDDPPASAPPVLPELADVASLEQRHSRNAPDIGSALAALRAGAGKDAWLVGEVYLPSARQVPYLDHVDAAFAFELLHAPWRADAMRAAIASALDPRGVAGRAAWVFSNHDFPRLPNRVGPGNARAAAMLVLTLPGPAFVYQGDEIGMGDGPGREPPHDRAGRDRHRHPMRWDDDAPHGGFTTGEPWLPAIEVHGGGVAAQAREPDSFLALYRDLVELRSALGDWLVFLDEAADGVLAYRRGRDHVVALNVCDEPRPAPVAGPVVRATHSARLPAGAPTPVHLQPGEGVVVRART